VQIRQLHDLELAVLSDSRYGLLVRLRLSPSNAHTRLLAVAASVQVQRSVRHQFPARTWFDGIGAKQNIHSCDALLRVARMPPCRPLDPQAGGSRLPLLARLGFVRHTGVQLSRPDVHNDRVLVRELLLLLAPNVHVCLGDPSGAQVQVFLHTVPFVLVELALGERVEGGARLHGDVGDDEAGVVQREVLVHGLRQDAVPAVEEEDEEEDGEDEQAELHAGAHLESQPPSCT
jgi:hypothetical protein